ncbi:MAG TPA: glycosyltransferase family 39 protein [bacterium]|nr:glycosyltransferase family 39 protein [bacterium]
MSKKIPYGRFILLTVLIISGILMGSIAYSYVSRCICAINYNQPLDYGEGPILNQVRYILQGRNYYKDINSPPYIIGNYPPVFNLLSLLLVPIFGVSFATGRFLAFLAVIGTSYIIYKIVLKFTENKMIAFLTALFYLAIDYVYVWGIYMRIDTLSIFFNMLGIYWVIQYEDNHKKLRWCILFFLLALYTRQSMIAGVAGAYIYLLTKDRKLAVKLIGHTALYGLLTFIFLNIITKGQFYMHIVKYNINTFTIRQLWFFLSKELFTYTTLIIISLIASIFWLKDQKRRIISLYFIFAFLVQFTAGKVGSMLNYLIEPVGVMGIIFGIIIGDTLKKKNQLINTGVAVLVLLQLANYYYGPNTLSWGWKPSPPLTALDRYVEESKGLILAENLGILPAHNRDIYFDPFIFTQLYYQGIWDQSKIIKDIEGKKFDIIMLEFDLYYDHWTDSDRWSKEMKQAMYENYYLIDTQGYIRGYAPIR